MEYVYDGIKPVDLDMIHTDVAASETLVDKAIEHCTWHEDTEVVRKGIGKYKPDENWEPEKHKGKKGVLVITWDGVLSEDDEKELDRLVSKNKE
jgi:hypothetical protein